MRILQHPDNFIVARSLFIAESKPLADGILIWKKVADKSFVHHRHFRGSSDILQGDFPAEQQLHSESVWIIRADKNCLSTGVFTFFGFVTLHAQSAGAI